MTHPQRGAIMVGILSLSVCAILVPVAIMPLRTREMKDPSEAPQPGFKKKGGYASARFVWYGSGSCAQMLGTRLFLTLDSPSAL